MEYNKSSKISNRQVSLVKEFSSLVGTAVLTSFPHMPSDLFSYARYEVNTGKNSSKSITVHFNYFRRVSSIRILLSEDSNNPSTIVAEEQMSYINMPTKRLLGIAKELSKGFWSDALNSSVNFVALRFSCDATYLESFYQKADVSNKGTKEYYNFIERFNYVD